MFPLYSAELSLYLGAISIIVSLYPTYTRAAEAAEIVVSRASIETSYEPGTKTHYGAVNLSLRGEGTDSLVQIDCENGASGSVWLRDDLKEYLGKDGTLAIPKSGIWIGPSAGIEANGYTSMIDDAHIAFRNLPPHLAMDAHLKCTLSFKQAGRVDVDFTMIKNMEQLISF